MKSKRKKASAGFAELISQAEKSVTHVTDDRLREIAFERVLDHLLSTYSGQDTGQQPTLPASRKSNVAFRNSNLKPATGTLAWLTEMHEEKFFKEPRSLKDILQELSNRSHILKSTDLTWSLQKLCHDKKLRRKLQAPADGGRKVFHWYNW